ncbi:hypothetical protein B566_EDAN007270 [Ephemera danica]|nr:hypothetical protein B566_EDAN007270 [Ephemera danica]
MFHIHFDFSYWRYSGDILQQKWNNFVDTFGEEQEPYWVYGTSLVVFVVFWIVGGVYTVMDITGKPAFLKRDVPMEPAITAARVLKVVKQDLINQFLVDIPVRFIAVPILMMRGVQPLRELPSVPVIIAQCMFMFVCYDFSIYYAHRFNTNYGVLGLIDWLHGTDKAYRKRRRAATPK